MKMTKRRDYEKFFAFMSMCGSNFLFYKKKPVKEKTAIQINLPPTRQKLLDDFYKLKQHVEEYYMTMTVSNKDPCKQAFIVMKAMIDNPSEFDINRFNSVKEEMCFQYLKNVKWSCNQTNLEIARSNIRDFELSLKNWISAGTP